MNILLVSQPAHDGVLRHVSELVSFLLSEGDRVNLAYSNWQATDQLADLLGRIQSAGGELLNLRIRNGPQPRDLPASLQLLAFIRNTRPDVIHAHSSKAGALVRGLGLLGLRTPIIYTPHSYYRMHAPDDQKAFLFHLLERLFGRVGMTIAGSESELRFAENVLGVPLSRRLLITNSVDFRKYCPGNAEDRSALRKQLGVPEEAKVLGSVGRLTSQKDPLSMYSAFAEVESELPDVYLVHLGQGELEAEVDALVAVRRMADRCRRIRFLGDPAPFYGALDGFVLTSTYEGMSYAVLEALAMNLPLVLTRAPGNIDFAQYGFSQINWCEPGDISSIANAIRDWRRRLARGETPNHRALSRSLFAQEVCFPPIREVYKQRCQSKASVSPSTLNPVER